MIVECVYNMQKDLPEDCEPVTNDCDWDFDLKLNKQYVVYAMTIRSNYIWYYICDEIFSYFPIWKPSPLFRVIDGSLSKFWTYSFIINRQYSLSETTIAFPEWANDPSEYYDHLSDGQSFEVNLFNKYREAMDLEFPLPFVQVYAEAIDDDWLFCKDCIDAWQSNICDQGMVRCPYCRELMHNPRYT